MTDNEIKINNSNYPEPEVLHEFDFIAAVLESFEPELNALKSKFRQTHERLFLEVSNNSENNLGRYSATLKLKGFKI